MNSTNDGKEVKSIQTSGQKGKSYYIELYKTLDAGLSGECVLRERTQHLCEAWRRVHSLCLHSAPATHPHLLSWLQRHTARTILQTEWQSPKSKDEQTHLERAIDVFLAEATLTSTKQDGARPPWEVQLQQRGEWFKRILGNPWGHPVLRVLLDPHGQRPGDDEILEWLKEERGVMFVTRLRQLTASKCDDLAMSLVTAVMDRVRASTQLVPDNEQAEDIKEKLKSPTGPPTFADILRTDAGFTVDVWELLTDIEFVLLHKGDRRSKCIELAKQTPLRNGYQLVERLQSRLGTSPREKKLWKNAKEVATLIAQVIIARCMVVGVCGGVCRSALYCCGRALSRLLGARLPAAAAALAAPAATARHLHTLAQAAHAQCSPDMKPFVCELYVRAITAGMNELERLKLKTEKESEARSSEQTLSTWFTQLGALLGGSERVRAECLLTAFSVHPAPAMYDRLRAAPALPPLALDTQETKAETTSEFGSWTTDSRTQSNLVKTSETINMKQTQHQANVLSTALLTEGEALGLSPELCQDLAVLLSGPRVKTLSWDMDREVLLENCRAYMERTHGGTRALTTELKYLNLDPSNYQHLPVEEDEENDLYYGIEKGYEHLVEVQEPEDVWDAAIFSSSRTESACSSYAETEGLASVEKRVRVPRASAPDSEDSDPLSLVAEAKRAERKEHSRSKEPAKKQTKEKKKRKKPIDSTDKEGSRERRKEPNKDKKKERKPRKPKVKVEQEPSAKPGSLSSLIGMKVAKIKIPEGKYKKNVNTKVPSISDSDYDSQGKSSLASLNSEGNDPDVLFDGLFNMEEYRSPEKTDPLADKNTLCDSELSVSNGKVLINCNPTVAKHDLDKPQQFKHNHNLANNLTRSSGSQTPPNNRTNPAPVTSSVVPKLDISTPKNDNAVGEEVKKSITRLIEFRRQKSFIEDSQRKIAHSNIPVTPEAAVYKSPNAIVRQEMPVSPVVSPKSVEVPEIPKVYINKKQTQQMYEIKQEVDMLNTKYTRQTNLPVAQSAVTQPDQYQKSTSNQGPLMQNTSLQANVEKLLSNYEQTNPAPRKTFQDFLKELQESINAGTGANKVNNSSSIKNSVKKEIPSVARTTPIILKTPKAEPGTFSLSAKPTPQTAKKVDSQLNTFARLSYMHKTKQNDKLNKQALDTRIQQEQEIARLLDDHKLSQIKYLQSKGDVVVSRVPQVTEKSSNCDPKLVIRKIEKSQPTLMLSSFEYPVLSNMLQTNNAQGGTPKQPPRTDNLRHIPQQIEVPSVVTPKATVRESVLSEKDQADLLLLLRQQSKLNNPANAVNNLRFPKNNVITHVNSTTVNYNHEAAVIKTVSVTPKEITINNTQDNDGMLTTTLATPPESIQNVYADSEECKSTKVNKVCKKPTPKTSTTASQLGTCKNIGTKGNNVESAKHQDWASVMDAILKHKTPSRGPNALDMALKKDSFSNSSLRDQRILRVNTPVTGLKIEKSNKASTPKMKVSTTQHKSTSSAESVIADKTLHRQNPPRTHTEVMRKSINADVPKRATQSSKKPYVCELIKEKDPFISGIPNSDYDLLEELMDDELRKEIGELSSDEDTYRAPPACPAKGIKILTNSKLPTKIITPKEKVGAVALHSGLTPGNDARNTIIQPTKKLKCTNQSKNTLEPARPHVAIVNVPKTKPITDLPSAISEAVTCPLKVIQPPPNIMPHNQTTEKPAYVQNISTNHINIVDPRSVIITAVSQPVIPKMVLLSPEIVYDGYAAAQLPGLHAANQTPYVALNSASNITVYQTTQFAAPVINEVIIGNAITMPATLPMAFDHNKSVQSDRVANTNTTAVAHDNPKDYLENIKNANAMQKNVDCLTQNEKVIKTLDINSNKNCERKVLSEVQEQSNCLGEKLDIKIGKQPKPVPDDTVKKDTLKHQFLDSRLLESSSIDEDQPINLIPDKLKDIERCREKRLAIINREINHTCSEPPIPLRYESLRQRQPESSNEKPQMKSLDFQEKYIESAKISVLNSNVQTTHKNSEINILTTPSRISNDLKAGTISDLQDQRNHVGRKTKVRLKNDIHVNDNIITNHVMDNVDKNPTQAKESPKRVSKRILQKKVEKNEPQSFDDKILASIIMKPSTKVKKQKVIEISDKIENMDVNTITTDKLNTVIQEQLSTTVLEKAQNEIQNFKTDLLKPVVNVDENTITTTNIKTKRKAKLKDAKKKTNNNPEDKTIMFSLIDTENAAKGSIIPQQPLSLGANQIETKNSNETANPIGSKSELLNSNVKWVKKPKQLFIPFQASQDDSNNIMDLIKSKETVVNKSKTLDTTLVRATEKSDQSKIVKEKTLIEKPDSVIKRNEKTTNMNLIKSKETVVNKSKTLDTTLVRPAEKSDQFKIVKDTTLIEKPDSVIKRNEKATNINCLSEVMRGDKAPEKILECNKNIGLSNHLSSSHATPANKIDNLLYRNVQSNDQHSLKHGLSKNKTVVKATSSSLPLKQKPPIKESNNQTKIQIEDFKDKIVIEELPSAQDSEKKCVRIKLPNGKTFKATVFGKMHVSFESLFSDPTLKSTLLSNITDTKRYTVNIKQISTAPRNDPTNIVETRIEEVNVQTNNLPMETVNLLSDDEDETTTVQRSIQTFKTEFGEYKVDKLDEAIFTKHQSRFQQKCMIKIPKIVAVMPHVPDLALKEPEFAYIANPADLEMSPAKKLKMNNPKDNLPEVIIPDKLFEHRVNTFLDKEPISKVSILESNIQATALENRANSFPDKEHSHVDKTSDTFGKQSDVIEIDDSSNDSIIKKLPCDTTVLTDIPPNCNASNPMPNNIKKPVIEELKSLLLKDLGISTDDVHPTIIKPTQGDAEVPDQVAEQQSFNPSIDECFVKLYKCDELVRKYEQNKQSYQKCLDDTLKCDNEPTIQESLHHSCETYENDLNNSDDFIDIDLVESNANPDSRMSRKGSFSLLDDLPNFNELATDYPNNCSENERTSPVIDVFETISSLKNGTRIQKEYPSVLDVFELIASLRKVSEAKNDYIEAGCYCEWYTTKREYYMCAKNERPLSGERIDYHQGMSETSNTVPSLQRITAKMFEDDNILKLFKPFKILAQVASMDSLDQKLKRKFRNREGTDIASKLPKVSTYIEQVATEIKDADHAVSFLDVTGLTNLDTKSVILEKMHIKAHEEATQSAVKIIKSNPISEETIGPGIQILPVRLIMNSDLISVKHNPGNDEFEKLFDIERIGTEGVNIEGLDVHAKLTKNYLPTDLTEINHVTLGSDDQLKPVSYSNDSTNTCIFHSYINGSDKVLNSNMSNKEVEPLLNVTKTENIFKIDNTKSNSDCGLTATSDSGDKNLHLPVNAKLLDAEHSINKGVVDKIGHSSSDEVSHRIDNSNISIRLGNSTNHIISINNIELIKSMATEANQLTENSSTETECDDATDLNPKNEAAAEGSVSIVAEGNVPEQTVKDDVISNTITEPVADSSTIMNQNDNDTCEIESVIKVKPEQNIDICGENKICSYENKGFVRYPPLDKSESFKIATSEQVNKNVHDFEKVVIRESNDEEIQGTNAGGKSDKTVPTSVTQSQAEIRDHAYALKVNTDCNYEIDTPVKVSLQTAFSKISSEIILKGIEYEDPVVGTCYVFPIENESPCIHDDDTFDDEDDEIIQVIQEIREDGTVDNVILDPKEIIYDEGNLKLNVPKVTYSKIGNYKSKYSKRSLKRKIDMSDIKIREKKYRKGKNIDYPKITVSSQLESAYSKEFKRIFDYSSSLKFSYSQPFHKDFIDVDDIIQNWPLMGSSCAEFQDQIDNIDMLFIDLEDLEKCEVFNPLDKSLAEELRTECCISEPSSDVNETNFKMGFGERSDRVIQNLEDVGDDSKFSAATLSDVKQTQPFLLSEDYDDYSNNQEDIRVMSRDDQIKQLTRYFTYIQMRDKVRSFFKKSTVELKYDWMKTQYKENFDCKYDLACFPFDLYNTTDFMEPSPADVMVQVVQVGQLPVSAAAQNPVTCDPRVTQVSNASPSQCSAENSLQDESQPAIKTEYTELTTADLSVPLMQEYAHAQHNQSMEPQAPTNMTDDNIPIQTEIKSVVKIELMEETEDKEEPKDSYDNNVSNNLEENGHLNNIQYPFDTNSSDHTQALDSATNYQENFTYEPPEKQNVEETYGLQPQEQKQQNGSQEKTDQIAHAMNAAGITTTSETMTTRAHALVNILSQKLRQGSGAGTQPANSYSKTTSINMALQQALAQILPSSLNQNNSENNQQAPNTQVTPQVLHIVQGKNASGGQITLVDNSQQPVINNPNTTPVLHIVQNKSGSTCATSNGSATPQTNSFGGLSLVDAGLQQGGNQLLHIVNTGNQKNNNTAGQLLKRVNLLTNLANVQGSNEQKMVQFVCKSADGKSIQLNAPHQRGMVLRLQPIETPPKQTDNQNLSPTSNNTLSNKIDVANQQEIKSRSMYEENYAKFIQNSSSKSSVPEKATSLPKFNQAFGKPVFQDGTENEMTTNNSHLSVNTKPEPADCQATDNAMNLDHISQITSPPLLLRKSPAQTSQPQANLVQQLKQTITPMNIQTMHGGVIYTRQIPVNIGGGQTINLITVPSTELVDESGQKQQTVGSQNEIEPSIIKIVPQNQPNGSTEISSEEGGTSLNVTNEGNQNPQPQQVLTQMRIKLPMLSKTPQMVSGARVVRPSFFQIQRNVIGGANQPVYQQLVLTAAPPLGQQTIRLPQAQTTRQIKVPTESQSSAESQMSSSTLEQLREFDMVLEQVKERSSVPPTPTSSNSFSKMHSSSSDTTDGSSTSSTSTDTSHQVLYSIGNNQYVNRKATVTTSTTSNFVRSPDSSGIVDSPTPSNHVQIPHTVTTETVHNDPPTQPKPKSSKSKSRPKASSNPPNNLKLNTVPPKTSTQKPLEDEQTTQRILYILAEYKEQVENSPDKDKPAPRRRTNPPSNPSGSSKRKKSSSSRRHGARDLSPIHGEDTCRTIGSEDSSCGTSQGDCNESCFESHSPQDSPRKVVRKLTFEHETPVQQPRPLPQRNVIVADGQTITVARGTAGKPTTAVLMPANYILPVSMVKNGQQIAIVTNRGPKLLTVGGGEGGATNALLLQRLIGPGGLKPVLRPGVRHVRLPTAALHNLQAFNLATATTVQPPDSTASPAPAPTPPELVDTRANSSPWTDRHCQDVKPEGGSSPEGSEPWHLPSSGPHDYTYEETVRTDNLDRTVLVVQKKDGSTHRQHRLTHVSAAALRHKYAILEHELRLQKSLSEECEDLGVDSPSASELFPEAELLFAASPAHDHTPDHAHHSHTPQPTMLNQSCIPQPDMDDQIATDQLIQRPEHDLNMGLDDVGIVTVGEDGMQTIALDQEEFARSHPNTTFHSEPDEGEVCGTGVQPFTIAGLKGRHITSTIFHSARAPATVLMAAPHATVIAHPATATATAPPPAHATQPQPNTTLKYADIDNMINSLPQPNNINLSSVLVKDDGLTRFDSILNDRELHLSNTASAIVHSAGNATQVIRRVCYDDDKRDRFLMDEPDAIIAGDDAKMVAEDSSRDSRDNTLGSMPGEIDDDRSSPERHTELFWESNSASERSEGRRPMDFSSDSEKCCKSPSYDETNSTDSSGVGTHMRLDSVIKDARGIERSGSADGSSADDTPPLRTYPAKRAQATAEARSVSGKTRAGERSPDSLETRRRASARGVVKRGCHCCVGSPAPPRPKKSRQRKPTIDFTN